MAADADDSAPRDPDPHLLDMLRLTLVPGVGSRTMQLLLERFGSPGEALQASLSELREVEGVGPKLSMAIAAARHSQDAEQEYRRCCELGIQLLPRDSDAYPEPLKAIHDPPGLLYVQGGIEPRDSIAVGIVGSRRCTLYGRQQAERLSATLARAGVTIVSGLARGIDAAAHQGAISAGGRTIAVLGTGLANIYPPEHQELSQRVADSGALVTENPLDQAPLPGLFPQRNRLISGLSIGVIVVEATRTSGSLHTARHAMEQGREVFAVPGRIDSLASEGCHDLIRDGVTLIRNADDVLAALGPLIQPVHRSDSETVHNARELTLSDQERRILNLITTEPLHQDEVLRATDLEPSRVLATLTVLEMKRFIRRLPGGHLCR
jgi:DNA processing protein